ncbi:RagB/SusD family nutrient uptake outer membrane protein [uncultured Duncaniella sp.]|uniref:RagB/SusD family nutrient uptake outer membrane protein n=1 Tax=uncultured Duncaniella sp. TaxID=2768039 RepID=UPI00264917BF|nr:RagB/SusD family nutrient uptake outer membrane protein [uncultured Duncaniella sp.]
MKIKLSYILVMLGALCASCSDFLDVQPSDRISEGQNFSTVAGFKQALNGIYIDLNASELYGRTLSCEFIEIMAQRYDVGQDNKAALEIMQLDFSGSSALSRLESMWGKAYNLIANTNLIIRNCEEARDVLPDEYYHIIKGEAYALRAYLHFDMFRLFGTSYTPEESTTALPYYTEFQLDVNPRLSSLEFMEKVLEDLAVAEEELKNDPIVTYGTSGNPKDVFLKYRNLRLNLYAVYGLMARCYYYIHDDENAYAYSKKVVDLQERYFPWINPIALTRASVDRVFSSELLFSLQNLQRDNLFTSLFDANNLKTSTLLAPRDNVVEQIFEGSQSASDYRVKASFKNSVELGGMTYRMFNKYQGADSLYSQMIPMIRVSEAYLILAETGPDDEERMRRFNEFRNARGLKGITNIRELNNPTDKYYSLYKEWVKEFYGEGQLFFWYKRNKCSAMRSATDQYDDYPFRVSPLSKYTLPIPNGESQYN